MTIAATTTSMTAQRFASRLLLLTTTSSSTRGVAARHVLSTTVVTRRSFYVSAARAYSAPATQRFDPQNNNQNAPQGDLWRSGGGDDNTTVGGDGEMNQQTHIPLSSTTRPSSDWIGKTATIRRTFGAQANADAMLLCGGTTLAAHASFDPLYARAQGWIHNHAVGPAVLSPILTAGLLTTLVEAAFPQAIPRTQSLAHVKPLIVGVAVNATIRVTNVTRSAQDEEPQQESNQLPPIDEKDESCLPSGPPPSSSSSQTLGHNNNNKLGGSMGYQIDLEASVARVRDGAVVTQGTMSLWLPDYYISE